MNPCKNPRASASAVPAHRPRRPCAFTTIELLVVMATGALLAAILCPAVQRASRHARAVVCRGQLRQWGLELSLLLGEQVPTVPVSGIVQWDLWWRPRCDRRGGLYLCPRATRYESNQDDPMLADREGVGCGAGSKSTAWKLPTWVPPTPEHGPALGSYGVNGAGFALLEVRSGQGRQYRRSCVPILLDCVFPYASVDAGENPPAYEGALTGRADITSWCIDRHHAAINSLLLDCSARPVGLKELWTLDWSLWFDPHGPWTNAGGVQREDWPAWMRAFKDY